MNSENKVQEFEFKAEMKQLLNLIINSLYSHPEVFIRELVSNSSDALNKVRFRALTDTSIVDHDAELKVNITLDKEAQTFSIEDSGIGMKKEDLINQLGTIASSGTMQFIKQMQEAGKQVDASMIGQFGVGFYSVFMVTDEITVETRHADADSTAYRWTSSGESNFTIEEIDRQERGTKITFKLKDQHKEFCDDWRVKSILNKYSNFVDFPVFIGEEKVNTVEALWHKQKDELTEEELANFYQFVSNDFNKHLDHLHLNIEGNVNFKALLFVPEKAPMNLFQDAQNKSVHLYSSKVFIQDNATELLPEYLRFIHGVIDTEDLPLNVSREVTQNSPLMAKIKDIVTGKLLSLFEDWAENNIEKFKTFYKEFGSMFKTGLNTDFKNKDRVVNLLRFDSTVTKEGEQTSLKEYVQKMRDDQKEIYYLSGDTKDSILRNPNLEYFKKHNIEVLLMHDPVDAFTIPYLNEFEGKPVVSIEKADIELKDDTNKEDALAEEEAKDILQVFKDVLGEQVEDVVESKRLVESPVTLVVGKAGMDRQMERMMKYMDKNFQAGKRVLEINTSHPILKNLSAMNKANADNPLIKASILQLFQGSLLMEGYMESPSEFVERMNTLIQEATK